MVNFPTRATDFLKGWLTGAAFTVIGAVACWYTVAAPQCGRTIEQIVAELAP